MNNNGNLEQDYCVLFTSILRHRHTESYCQPPGKNVVLNSHLIIHTTRMLSGSWRQKGTEHIGCLELLLNVTTTGQFLILV